MKYQDFLKTKMIEDIPTGIFDNLKLSTHLFDFQKDIVKWAIKRGKRAKIKKRVKGTDIFIMPSARSLGIADYNSIHFDAKVACHTARNKKQMVRFPGKRR